MSQEIFPNLPGLAWGAKRTPIFKTLVHSAASGAEVRIAQRKSPLWRFEFDIDYLTVAHVQLLEGIFLRHRGSADSFLFEYPRDRAVTDQVFGVGNGITKSFQLVRTYGGFTEAVCNLNGIPAIKRAGAVVSSGVTVVNGVVTFTTAPAAGVSLTWTGGYFYRARFDEDEREVVDVVNQIFESKSIVLLADLGARL